jgi:hypothetical protein
VSKCISAALTEIPIQFQTTVRGELEIIAGERSYVVEPEKAKAVVAEISRWWGLFPRDSSVLGIVQHGTAYWTLNLNGTEINGYSNEQYAQCAYIAVQRALQHLGLMSASCEDE